jgi:hypothetical protein
MKIQKNVLILIGLISLAYIIVVLLSPKDVTDYTVVDTEYWHGTENRLIIKTAYDYNNKEELQAFPKELGDWKGFDYKYADYVYKTLNADILLSRAYVKNQSSPIWIDLINSKTRESFHNPKICVTGAGWAVDKEYIQEFKIADPPNPFTKLYADRLDISKEDKKQMILYWFMFKKFGGKDAVTMIKISSPVYNDDMDSTFNSVKDFLENQLFRSMYRGTGKEEITNAEYISRVYGNKGLLAMFMGILIPLGTTIIGVMRKD